jgi:uncharacterized protein (UPF0335 family)
MTSPSLDADPPASESWRFKLTSGLSDFGHFNSAELGRAPRSGASPEELSMPATAEAQEQPATRFAKDQLKAVVERVERLEEEKKALSDDIKDVYAEAKAHGFDVKALRTIVRLRKQDTDERKEQEAILETYMLALGMVA